MRPAPACALSLAALAAACGPVPVEQAEADCFRQAQLASHPRGTLGFGFGTGGARFAQGDVEISSDWLTGRDPSQVYASCVQRESGQPPRRPLYDRPDWKG
ncbi:hypothetical protein [Solirhodobacter olei]|uniref:hypothetical protein n=1 Tax=Solirhodobacter olei TaxID=2493082 RepID=UPI000FDBC02C|nr:hypothetical protein [Solirhodobacter olei]